MQTIHVKTENDIYTITTNTNTFIQIENETTSILINISSPIATLEVDGDHTIESINLAFTFLKEYAPHIKRIGLEDKYEFPYTLPNGRLVKISMALYNLAFDQKTWYECHFGAYLQNESLRKMYESAKHNFFDPKCKLKDFSFNNNDIETILRPSYETAPTWKEFFDILYQHDKKCELMFIWYQTAINQIMNGVSYERQSWYIDLYENPLVKNIEYELVSSQNGGYKRRKTRRRERKYESNYIEPLSYEEIQNMRFDPIIYGAIKDPHK